MKIIKVAFILLLLIAGLARVFVPMFAERSMNLVLEHSAYPISPEAKKLHEKITVMDWHSDALLWDRNLLKRSSYGHTDFPRLVEGGVAIQMFTAVTKSPKDQNYSENSGNTPDSITTLALAQTWPPATWSSLKERALHQANRLKAWQKKSPDSVRLVTTRDDLVDALSIQPEIHGMRIALLGIEGLHALDGDIEALSELIEAGFTMMALQHFFDNKLGGSLHGVSKGGLTEFGKQVVTRLNDNSIIIDVSHSSEAVVRDVLAISERPIVMSHTGLKGICKTERNISDELTKQIAQQGGLIAIGFWDAAVCDVSPAGIVKSIRYAIDLLGEDHVALGSDYDGTVTTSFDVSELAVLTDEMLKQGFSEAEIRKVMGDNSVQFLLDNLPQL